MGELLCPILKVGVGTSCKLEACPFHSVKNSTGCWHGEEVTVRAIAGHKRKQQVQIKHYLEKVDGKIKRWMAFYAYAQWCGDATPSEEDIAAWQRRKILLPMRLPIFGFVTVERFARMRNPKALAEYENNHLKDRINLRKLLELK